MPIINIQISTDITPKQADKIAKESTRIMTDILNKDMQLTAVTIHSLCKSNWYIGAINLEEKQIDSAFIDIKISENSNTSDEKSSAIKAFYTLLEYIIGPIDNTSYVCLHEIPKTDWGYGGKTQEARRIKRTNTGSIDTAFYLDKGKKERSQRLTDALTRQLDNIKKAIN